MDDKASGVAQKLITRIPRTVLMLGLVSLFMDISSEMIHSLLPLFMVSALNLSVFSVGLIEGIAEATALITRTFSGAISDRFRKRKLLTLVGYGLGALSKPLFAAAPNTAIIFSARFIDRIGKGIRGAPRDALVADVTPAHIRGAAYGFRQSLDNAGAFLGPFLAVIFMLLSGNNFRLVFWIAFVPAILSVAVLALGVKEPKNVSDGQSKRPIGFHDIAKLNTAYWVVVMLGFVFTLARFSEAFLLLKAQSVGIPEDMVPLMMVLMNIVYSLTAYPVGRLSDRIGRNGLMASGLVVLILSDTVLAISHGVLLAALGTALWGMHLGMTQGLLSAMVADTAPENLRGSAFGIFSMISGVAMLAASVIAGFLWNVYGDQATFITGATIAGISLVGFISVQRFSKLVLPRH